MKQKSLFYAKTKKLKNKGVTLIELASMIFLFVLIAFLGLDMGILVFAADTCDKTCRDCARAAGTGRTPGQAIDAMNAALATHAAALNSLMMSNLQAQLMVYEDYSPNTPNTNSNGTNGPWVTTTGSALPAGSSTSTSGGANVVPAPNTAVSLYINNSATRTAYSPGPYCVVQTTLQARVPAPIFFSGVQFNGNSSIGANQMGFVSTYSFPLLNLYQPVTMANIPIQITPPSTQGSSSGSVGSSSSGPSSTSSSGSSGSSSGSSSSSSTSASSSSSSSSSASSSVSSSSSASSSSSGSSSGSSGSSSGPPSMSGSGSGVFSGDFGDSNGVTG